MNIFVMELSGSDCKEIPCEEFAGTRIVIKRADYVKVDSGDYYRVIKVIRVRTNVTMVCLEPMPIELYKGLLDIIEKYDEPKRLET